MFFLLAGMGQVRTCVSVILPLLIVTEVVRLVYTSPIAPPFDAAINPYVPLRKLAREKEPSAAAKVV